MNFESRIAAVKEGLEELNSLLENMSVFVEKEQATGSFTEFYDFFRWKDI